jgi:hypothetical protein
VLNTAQVQALNTSQLQALTTVQAGALSTTATQALTTVQVQALQTTDLAAFKTTQIVALTTAQIRALTIAQVAALTTAQDCALTTTQVAAMTTDQISNLKTLTPIVLDLNGDGVKTLGAQDGVKFDLAATGHTRQTGWVDPNDGLLVRDVNGDGQINDGAELFGSATKLPSGERAGGGYAALQAMDSNNDGVISRQDAGWNELQVWTDRNSDGVSQADELASLDALGIAKLDLAADATTPRGHQGNWVGLTSNFETLDGQTHEMADVWFAKNLTEAVTTLREESASAGTLSDAMLPNANLAARASFMTTALSDYMGMGHAASPASVTSALTSTTKLLDNGKSPILAAGGVANT